MVLERRLPTRTRVRNPHCVPKVRGNFEDAYQLIVEVLGQQGAYDSESDEFSYYVNYNGAPRLIEVSSPPPTSLVSS